MGFREFVAVSIPTALLAISLLATGCGAFEDNSSVNGSRCATGALAVSPQGPISLGFLEEQPFQVTLLGPDNEPLPGEPISVSLIGPAHNGFITPLEITSDESGLGQVVFTAPDTETQIEIRFSSPAVYGEPVVDVSVNPAELGLAFEIDYDGQRQLASVEATLYPNATCDQVIAEIAGEPIETQSAQTFPAEFDFVGLLAGNLYALHAAGLNAEDEVRATACIDGLQPDGPDGDILLVDMPFDVVGNYAVTTVISTSGALAPVVDELAASLYSFSADAPGEILDAIREVIADEPLVVESFDEIRLTQGLDGLLVDDFASREVNVSGSLTAIWGQVNDSLEELELEAELEASAPIGEIHDLLHTITLVSFYEIENSYFVSLPETGAATAQAASDDVDLLFVSQHHVGLILGAPLRFLLSAELAEAYATESLAQTLETIVDCDAVGAVLAAPLVDVVDSAEILAGCQNAMLGAETELDEATDWINANYAQVSFDAGTCRLADPGIGNSVEELVEGVFEVTWLGDVPLGPMIASFGGLLQQQ